MSDRLNESQLQRLKARDYWRQSPQDQSASNAVALWNDIDTALRELLRLRSVCESLLAENESLRLRAKKYREDVDQLLSERERIE